MKIDINGPNGNTFTILGIARKLLIRAERYADADTLVCDVSGAATVEEAHSLIYEATRGAVQVVDGRKTQADC